MAITSLWAPSKVQILHGRRGEAGAEDDLEALLARIRRRLYPETIPVLGSYWLKTIYAKGHKLAWWKGLNRSLKHVIREEALDEYAREVLIQIQSWIQQNVLQKGATPEAPQTGSRAFRANLTPERLICYVRRMLNQWVPAEIAYLLTDDGASATPTDDGIPSQSVAKAIERLLVRDRLSPATLEMLLQPELLSPRYIYPADAEILRDVVLALLGQTRAQAAPVMPAIVLTLAPGTPLPTDYREAVGRAFLVEGERTQEIHVPITAAQALEMLRCDSMRIASTIVTMDGRWWDAENLESGEQNAVVYQPAGQLRIDFSSEHARLAVPLPHAQLRWSGPVNLHDRYELFGREWYISSWETDGERSWAHLVFSRVLPTPEVPLSDNAPFRRSHPAFVDMAWSAMADALASALARKNREPIEQLRRSELIPLGRALYGFAESAEHGRLRQREMIETQLKSIRYLEAELVPVYGRAPWGILPASVQRPLLRSHPDAGLLELLNTAFDEVPQVLAQGIRKGPESGNPARPTSPSRAA